MTQNFPTLEPVELAALFHGDAESQRACGEALLAAFQSANGFVVTGFPTSALVDGQVNDTLAFFDLDDPERLALATRWHRDDATHCYRGYFPLPKERGWAHNEIFDFGPAVISRAPDGHPVKRFLEEGNQWPAREPHDGWREGSEALFADLHKLAHVVMAALTDALDDDAATTMDKFGDGNGTLRALHYPPPPEGFIACHKETLPERVDAAGRRIITHRHIDACVLSVLWQDAVGGLQYESRDGTWYEVPAGCGRLSIHAGRAMELMTGGRIKGTPHRVVGVGQDRCSMGFFLEPDFGAVIGRDDDGNPITYADHMKDDFADLEVYADVMGDAVAA
ncbi:MAG: isopenicillin N synthase family oxygenase [Rhodospirillales bacterium]|nr:isopenicillin N synthase family oxygenase [Rhodospirillales bacterium]